MQSPGERPVSVAGCVPLGRRPWLTWCKNKHRDKKATVISEIEQLFLKGHYKGDC